MEYTIVCGENNLYGIWCNGVEAVPCKYRSVKPVPHTDLFVVEQLSGEVIDGKLVWAKNVLDGSNGFAKAFDDDFYQYEIIDKKVVPKKVDAPTMVKVPKSPESKKSKYNGYQF